MWVGRYEPRWHSQVIDLGNAVFGEGYFSEPWFRARQPDSIVFLAHDDDSAVFGFAHGRILPQNGLGEYLGPAVTDIPAEIARPMRPGTSASSTWSPWRRTIGGRVSASP